MTKTDFLLEKIIDNVPGIIFQFEVCPDGSTKFPFVSKGFSDIFDVPADSFKEDASLALSRVHSEDYIPLMRTLTISQKDLGIFNHTFRIITSVTKKIIWLKITATPETKDPKCTTWHGYMSNVTKEMSISILN